MAPTLITTLGVLVLLATVVAVLRGIDVRIALIAGALCLGCLAGNPSLVFRTFFNTLTDERYIIPICSAMGFAYVLRQSGCDRHMVLMLMKPVQRIRPLLIPGAVAVGFFVNVAVISQASTAVAVGMVIIPLLRAAGLSPAAVGAALLMGASLGGELLNPGAPELLTVATKLTESMHRTIDSRQMQPVIAPLLAVQLTVATALLWWRIRKEPLCEIEEVEPGVIHQVNYLKAIVPLLPLALLMSAGPPLNLFSVPRSWLFSEKNEAIIQFALRYDQPDPYSARIIGASMLIGSVIAVLVVPSTAKQLAKAFFEGAGYALTTIISVIVAANCFGEGIKALKLAEWIAPLTKERPRMVWPLAGLGALAFAVICGSGMATTQSLYQFFVQPAADATTNLRIGAVVSIAAAAGRTTSPAAAVVLLCASLVSVSPLELLRRVWLPLVLATATTTVVAALMY
ncbi:MAG: C4-dicarboxylate transporter DcuC [Gemmataceae bacterium]